MKIHEWMHIHDSELEPVKEPLEIFRRRLQDDVPMVERVAFEEPSPYWWVDPQGEFPENETVQCYGSKSRATVVILWPQLNQFRVKRHGMDPRTGYMRTDCVPPPYAMDEDNKALDTFRVY